MQKLMTFTLFFLASQAVFAEQVIFADQPTQQNGSLSMQSALAAPERIKTTKQPTLAELQIAAVAAEATKEAELETKSAVEAANKAAAAIKAPPPKKLALQIDLNYQQPDEKGMFEICLVKNTVKTLTNNHEWMKVQDQENDNSEFFVLLSKVENATENEVTLKFIVLDTSTDTIMMHSPQVVLPYGQKKLITLNQDNQTMQLVVTANLG